MVNPPTPKAPRISGALVSDEDAWWLSERLALLADQADEISEELLAAGYGTPAAADRDAISALAATSEERSRLDAYWREWAKERLAALAGPVDILRGKYPKSAAYRSSLMAELRKNAAAAPSNPCAALSSPQIEPTLKRYIEGPPAGPAFQRALEQTKMARQQAVAALHLVERPDFAGLAADAKYQMLLERYASTLEPAGFKLDSSRKASLVFRKISRDKRWAFIFVDASRGEVEFGKLSPRFALTLPRKAILADALALNAVATFLPEDIIPRFRASCGFRPDSYAEFCLAADTVANLARIVFRRLDSLLVA
jgi:hypothetical protein